MPEYLAPGVYVEETSFRAKSIEGVGTSTTGFVGVARYGPIAGEPELLTSFSQFERIYGGIDPLAYETTEGDSVRRENFLAHAVRAFFDNGGSRLYVARAFSPKGEETSESSNSSEDADGNGAASTNAVDAVAQSTAKAPVPTFAIEIATADEVASNAATQILEGLSAGITALNSTRSTLQVIKTFAAERLSDEVPQDNSNAPSPRQKITDAADAQITAITNARNAANSARTSVGEAYKAGLAEGDGAPIPTGTASRTSELNTLAATAAETSLAAQGVQSAATGLKNQTEELKKNLKAMVDEPTATAVIDEAITLIAAVNAIANGSDATTVNRIKNTARLSRIEKRTAIANAKSSWVARFPGAAGNMSVVVTGHLKSNVLRGTVQEPIVALQSGDLVLISQGNQSKIYEAKRDNNNWVFESETNNTLQISGLIPDVDNVYPLRLTVEARLPGKFSQTLVWSELTASESINRLRDSVTAVFAEDEEIINRLKRLETPLILRRESDVSVAQLATALLNVSDYEAFISEKSKEQAYLLADGDDGVVPEAIAYEGTSSDAELIKTGLKSLEDIEEIAIVAAPGYSYGWNEGEKDNIIAISQAINSHCDRLRYRVAILDSSNDQAPSGIQEYRGLLDTTRAALYYPWITVVSPLTNQQINLPPSGFMAGIYARNDVEIGVHKAPANEVVRGAVGLETTLNKAQQDILNPDGINCIRFFEGRGIRVWGARTISSDPEWKYLNIRRYFAYLEASIDKATQWSVFQPNGERLWENVRRSVEGFLENEWREGHLAGSKLEQAFFVRCDRSTMTQNDLDNGRLICLIGVAPLYPAEFVIFRIGQWTADQR